MLYYLWAMKHINKTYLTAILFILSITNLLAKEMEDSGELKKYLPVAVDFKLAIAPDTEEYNLTYSLKDKINDDIVYIYRFEPGNPQNLNLHHAHITVIVDSSKKLKGFAWTDEKMSGKNNLDDKKCRQLALAFFKQFAPDLRDIRFQWVDTQRIRLIDKNNVQNELHAQWVKYKEADNGHYLWVLLAPDGRVMEFDRDIVWSFFRGGRVNELWLRDEWLSKRIHKK